MISCRSALIGRLAPIDEYAPPRVLSETFWASSVIDHRENRRVALGLGVPLMTAKPCRATPPVPGRNFASTGTHLSLRARPRVAWKGMIDRSPLARRFSALSATRRPFWSFIALP